MNGVMEWGSDGVNSKSQIANSKWTRANPDEQTSVTAGIVPGVCSLQLHVSNTDKNSFALCSTSIQNYCSFRKLS